MNLIYTWWPLWFAWLLQGLFGWYNVWAYRRKMLAQDEAYANPPGEGCRPAALLVPIKGVGVNFEAFLNGLLTQEYPDYHVILTVEAEADPTYAAIRRHLRFAEGRMVWKREKDGEEIAGLKASPGLREVRLNIGGLSTHSSQKIQNQLSALRYFEERDRIIAFADADIYVTKDWLRRLLDPLNHGTHPVSTTYRWLIPERPTLSNLMASCINGSVGTLGGPEWCNLTWGGSYALTREAYEIVNLPESYKGCLNDDLQMAHVTHQARLRIGFVRSLMRPSPIDYSWSSFYWFGWRQYFQVRIYSPYVWSISLIATFFYVAAFLTAWGSLLLGDLAAAAPIVLMAAMNLARSSERTKVVNYLFSGETLRRLKPVMVLDRYFTVIWLFIHFLLVVGTSFARKITWSGITYRVRGRQDTTVLAREMVKEKRVDGAGRDLDMGNTVY